MPLPLRLTFCLCLSFPRLLAPRRPGYLTANFSGPAKYRGKNNSHFSTSSALFLEKGQTSVDSYTRWQIFVSDIGFFGALAAIAGACYLYGFSTVACYYIVPYLLVNLDLVLITYLQHTDVYIRHYRGKAFTWERGALSTVDRSYGWLLDAAFHHIADTHVVHHLFHTMPFYNAIEATKIVRKSSVLGPYYLRDDTPIPAALWRSWSKCRYVDDEGEVLEWRDAKDLSKSLKESAGKKAK